MPHGVRGLECDARERLSKVTYIHGFDPVEVARLARQARTLARWTMQGVTYPHGGRVLEVGCGVGAELAILAERQPDLQLIGLDLSASQLAAAHSQLAGRHIPLVQAAGDRLPIRNGSLDGVFTCWLLEHVPDPLALLVACRRALKPGAPLFAREVDNDSFRIYPESAAVDQLMQVLNAEQRSYGGDPVVGRRLHALLLQAGFQNVRVTLVPVHADATTPAQHRELAQYFHDLLASVVPACLQAGLEPDVAKQALADLAALKEHPHGSSVHVARFASAVA